MPYHLIQKLLPWLSVVANHVKPPKTKHSYLPSMVLPVCFRIITHCSRSTGLLPVSATTIQCHLINFALPSKLDGIDV